MFEVEEIVEIVAAPVGADEATKLALDEYMALPKQERTILRRLAFGMKAPDCFTCTYDLAHIKAILTAENERTGQFPERWVDQSDEDEIAQFLSR